MNSRIIVFYYLLFTGYEGLIVDGRSTKATYRFTTCGSRGREGPTMMKCTHHYCNNGSLVCGHLLDEGTRGSQIFVVPRSGNYTVTIAGASGGHGVCSNYSGLGVIARNTVKFRRGERLRILVGQQGVSACDGHQDIDVCQLSNDLIDCEHYWQSETEIDVVFYDGGAGGGGASLLEYATHSSPIVVAPGGGGAGALYSLSSFLNISYSKLNSSRTYTNYTNGDAFNSASGLSNGTRGFGFSSAAGPGAGYYVSNFGVASIFPDALSGDAFGGKDCSKHFTFDVPFSNTHGGFGGGGGGCEGGGGGGGYTGGSVPTARQTLPGEGGYSWPDPPWPLIGYNDGDGYVELFLESCGCTYYCNMLNESSFECSCPPDTSLAPNGLDCYREENIFIESEVDLITFPHSMYGEVTADVVMFGETIFAYSTAVIFSNDSSSDKCAVMFLNNVSSLVATTKFINRSAETLDLKLFTVNTIVSDNGSVTADVSINGSFILQEPLSVTSVVTFGIRGDCILEELIANTSIDDIVEYNSNKSVNIMSATILHAYLDSFLPDSNSSRSNDNFFTTTVLIGITVSGSVVVMAVVLMIVCVCVMLCRQRKHFTNFDLLERYVEYNIEDYHNISDSGHTLNHYSQELWYSSMNSYQYSQLHRAYENSVMDSDKQLEVQESVRKRCDTLKYGLESPQNDYYHFNCSRHNDDWRYDRGKLIYMREIGEGQFGKVLLMSAKDICGVKGSVLVAVKTLTSRDPTDIARFSKEISLMKRFIHPNIVSLLGHCEATSDGAPLMILELMQYGDLKWFLAENRPREQKPSVITVNIALCIISDIAIALEYLAASKYVHRDVAARNCVVGAHFKAKLADFGLACSIHEKDYYEVAAKTLLPVRWAAPESLIFGKFTTASDVWSFGVLVSEVATYGETPYKQLQTIDIVEMARDGSLKLDRPAQCPVILADLIAWCTRIKPDERPSYAELIECCSKRKTIIS